MMRLYCFPYAGGGASIFRQWQKYLPANIQVCPVEMPGRGIKISEPPIADYRSLIRTLATELVADFREELSSQPDLRYAIFGHSAGARFGVAVASIMTQELDQAPLRCLLSGASPPDAAVHEPVRAQLSDEQWISELRSLGGTPPEILAEPELMRFLLPIMRADFSASEGSHVDSELRLACPLTLIAADDDADVPPREVWEWARYTSGGSRRALLQGDHFSVLRDPRALLDEVRADLLGAVATSHLSFKD